MTSLTQEEKDQMRTILSKWYGAQVREWSMTEKVYLELVEIIQKSRECTEAMDFVPRPLIVGNPLGWLKKEIRNAVLRFLTEKSNEYYVSCMYAVALGRKTAIWMASRGM